MCESLTEAHEQYRAARRVVDTYGKQHMDIEPNSDDTDEEEGDPDDKSTFQIPLQNQYWECKQTMRRLQEHLQKTRDTIWLFEKVVEEIRFAYDDSTDGNAWLPADDAS